MNNSLSSDRLYYLNNQHMGGTEGAASILIGFMMFFWSAKSFWICRRCHDEMDEEDEVQTWEQTAEQPAK